METNDFFFRVEDVHVHYGKAAALRGVSLGVRRSEVVTLLGANGSGKTTLLNMVSGFLPLTAGDVQIGGRSIKGRPPHAVVRTGVVQVSQYRDLFPQLSVRDNLVLGAAVRGDDSDEALESVYAKFPRLKERHAQKAITLSGGEQQMLAIGRALMTRPEIILFDEPSAGLAPMFVDEIARIMRELKDEGRTMLLVEQNMRLAMNLADRFYILRDGEVREEGDCDHLRANFDALARTHYL
ncbi:MAG: ABC transporter ATP-binding protein [Shinella sp. 65-6]|nr:MAG: ABC transporter ATP-binding protein [Shinella sp. 65-6]